MKKNIRTIYILFSLFSIITANSFLSVAKLNIKENNSADHYTIDQIPLLSQDLNKTPFVVACSYPGLAKLDPVDTWDSVSMWVQYQVVEGLVKYNLSNHPYYEIIPALAEYWFWESSTRISFKIRENVYFHDGTLLDADAVKWNFERLKHFSNVDGNVVFNDTSKVGFTSSLYYLPNGTYLFDSFESDGAYNFTINLNGPFGVLLDLLCFISSSIISPTSHKFYEIIQLDEILVGTGPFVFYQHIPRVHIRLRAYNNYRNGKAEIEELIFQFVDDDTTRMQNALAGEYDFVTGVLKTYIDAFKAASNMHVEDLGENLNYCYFEFYAGPRDYSGNLIIPGDYQYQRNNATLRRALTYALNYTDLIENIQSGKAFYGVPAVPRAMPGHNASIWFAYNESSYANQIAKARDLMMMMYPTETAGLTNVLDGGVNDAAWIAIAQGTTPLWDMQINEHSGGSLSTKLTLLLKYSWALIGVDVDETVREWGEYLDIGETTPWVMDGGFVGWGPDYLNPHSMIVPLFNLNSGVCFSRINDTSPGGLTESMKDATEEIDYFTSLLNWERIQSLLYDVRFENPVSSVHIPMYTYFAHQVHVEGLEGFQYNVANILDFYSCKWNKTTPGYFQLSSDADDPDYDGTFNLNWDISALTENYSVYRSNSPITVIDSNVTEIANGLTNRTYSISGLGSGDWYFMIIAFNEDGNKSSNVINVMVQYLLPGSFLLNSDAGDPDRDGNFNLTWTTSIGADKYSLYMANKSISVINTSLIILLYQTALSSFPVIGLPNGEYYFVVVAHNLYGETMSNNLHISVNIAEGSPSSEISGYNTLILIGITVSTTLFLIKKKKTKSKSR
ncbi:MAG: ABC transporter substrate-binding protein [Candidatus Thorarchaeota archaeon]